MKVTSESCVGEVWRRADGSLYVKGTPLDDKRAVVKDVRFLDWFWYGIRGEVTVRADNDCGGPFCSMWCKREVKKHLLHAHYRDRTTARYDTNSGLPRCVEVAMDWSGRGKEYAGTPVLASPRVKLAILAVSSGLVDEVTV